MPVLLSVGEKVAIVDFGQVRRDALYFVLPGSGCLLIGNTSHGYLIHSRFERPCHLWIARVHSLSIEIDSNCATLSRLELQVLLFLCRFDGDRASALYLRAEGE